MEPFDHADGVFDAKFDGSRAAADTVRGRLISRNGTRTGRFDAAVLDLLPSGPRLRPRTGCARRCRAFNELLFGRRRPSCVAFDLLEAHGVDLRPLSLKDRKARLAAIGKRAKRWIALTNGLVGEGCALSRALVNANLEGIVAKRLTDAYHPKLARWHKMLNPSYSQRRGRAQWFRERQGRYAGRRRR